MLTAGELKLELDKLALVLDGRIERTKDTLNSKTKLLMDLSDVGFTKISDIKYSLDIKNRGRSYITFMLTFRGRNVDILQDHLVIYDKQEVPISTLNESYSRNAVRYGRVMEEIFDRASFLITELSKEN